MPKLPTAPLLPGKHSITRRTALSLTAGAALLSPGRPLANAGDLGTADQEDLDRQSAALNTLLAGPEVTPLHRKSVAQIREDLADRARTLQSRPVEVGEIVNTDVPLSENKTPARLYRPVNPADVLPPILLYFHGGSLISGSIETHDHVARRLCRSCGALVISIDYRLAPEAPYPAALEDCAEALDWVARQGSALGGDPKRIGLAGDDAGGLLAAVTAVNVRMNRPEGLRFLGLMTPLLLLNDEPLFESREVYGQGGYQPSLADLAFIRKTYLSLEEEEEEPSGVISPLEAASFRGLPTTLVISAGHALTRDDGGFFVRRQRENEVASGERQFPTTIHDFMFYAPLVDVADLAFGVMGAQFRRAVNP